MSNNLGERPELEGAYHRIEESLVRFVRTQTSKRAVRERATRSGVWLSPSALGLLAELERHGPAQISSVGSRLRMHVSRASREVHDLAGRGYVSLGGDPADARKVVATITPHGRTQLAAYRSVTHGLLAEILDHWDEADVETFARLFEAFTLEAASIGRASVDAH
jgi:DNA-binding MarR family transcriptional regulator